MTPPAVVVQGCNPSYSGGGDQESHSMRPGKKVQETPISTNRPGMLASACHPSYTEDISRKVAVCCWPQAKMGDPTWKKANKEKRAGVCLCVWLKW
jgi:hypothetical protein